MGSLVVATAVSLAAVVALVFVEVAWLAEMVKVVAVVGQQAFRVSQIQLSSMGCGVCRVQSKQRPASHRTTTSHAVSGENHIALK